MLAFFLAKALLASAVVLLQEMSRRCRPAGDRRVGIGVVALFGVFLRRGMPVLDRCCYVVIEDGGLHGRSHLRTAGNKVFIPVNRKFSVPFPFQSETQTFLTPIFGKCLCEIRWKGIDFASISVLSPQSRVSFYFKDIRIFADNPLRKWIIT